VGVVVDLIVDAEVSKRSGVKPSRLLLEEVSWLVKRLVLQLILMRLHRPAGVRRRLEDL
jgi:hypothetical protein